MAALEQGDWGRGQRRRRGRGGHALGIALPACGMPGMDGLAEDLLRLCVRPRGGYGSQFGGV